MEEQPEETTTREIDDNPGKLTQNEPIETA